LSDRKRGRGYSPYYTAYAYQHKFQKERLMESVQMLVIGIAAALGFMALGVGGLILGAPSPALRRASGKRIPAREQ